MSGVHTHNMSDHLYSYPFKELHDCYLALDQSFQVQRPTELLIDYRKVPKKSWKILTNIPWTPLTPVCYFLGEMSPNWCVWICFECQICNFDEYREWSIYNWRPHENSSLFKDSQSSFHEIKSNAFETKTIHLKKRCLVLLHYIIRYETLWKLTRKYHSGVASNR